VFVLFCFEDNQRPFCSFEVIVDATTRCCGVFSLRGVLNAFDLDGGDPDCALKFLIE
tara:strand:+ start:25833 stop:26003 length:171 start_codon:yes stop_codon:yes gene_type:complete